MCRIKNGCSASLTLSHSFDYFLDYLCADHYWICYIYKKFASPWLIFAECPCAHISTCQGYRSVHRLGSKITQKRPNVVSFALFLSHFAFKLVSSNILYQVDCCEDFTSKTNNNR